MMTYIKVKFFPIFTFDVYNFAKDLLETTSSFLLIGIFARFFLTGVKTNRV